MNEQENTIVISEMIKNTYEIMGMAVLSVNPYAQGVFKLEIIDGNGLKEVFVTVLLHMTGNNLNAPNQR
jgi:hypothetical protein